MRLFDNAHREDLSERKGDESLYAFLNRCAHSKTAETRERLERWFEEYPDEEKEYLREELQAEDEDRYYSALLTLFCHRLFKRHGYELECHPDIPGETRHPDFLVKKEKAPLFYLECTVSFEPAEEQGKKAILKQIYDLLDPKDFGNFYLCINLHREALITPSARSISTFLQNKIASLDPDELFEQLLKEGMSAMPSFPFTQKEWEMEFTLIPKPEEKRGKEGIRPVGMEIRECHWIDSRQQLLNRLKTKAKRYGELPLPYIVAIDSRDIFLEDDDIHAALVGTESWTIELSTGRIAFSRKKDGFLIGPREPKNTTVSAILVTKMVNAINPATTYPSLWINPWARHTFNLALWKGHKKVLKDGTDEVEFVAGRSVMELL